MIAVGQKTILDYNDAITLSMIRNANRALSQVIALTGPDNTVTFTTNTTWKDGSNTTPSGTGPTNWAPRPSQQYLYASLYKAGVSLSPDLLASGGDNGANIDNVKWKIGANTYTLNKSNSRWSKNSVELGSGGQYATDGNYFFQTVAPYGVIVVDNVLSNTVTSIKFEFYCEYTDTSVGLVINASDAWEANAVVNGMGAFYVNIAIPDGKTIRNGVPATVRLQAEMYANGSLDTSSPGTITWSVYNPSTTNWDTVSNVANQTELSTINGITNGQLKLYDVAVIGTECYKASIVRTEGTFVAYIVVDDMTDPLLAQPVASTDVLKNGAGNSTLTAKLISSTGEVDSAGTTYNYAWEAFDANASATKFRSNPIFSTTASASAAQGATSLSVASVGSGRQGIQAGDIIVANAGTAQEMIITVTSVASLVLTVPALAYAISSGAAIYVVDKVAGSSTVASGSGTTLNVASGTPFVAGAGEAGDIIAIGSGDTTEYRRVTAKATNALTLDKPLSAANYASGVAVNRRNNLRMGKSITITETDVSSKANFFVYVS